MNTVKIRNLIVGEGCPKVIIPIVAEDAEGIYAKGRELFGSSMTFGAVGQVSAPGQIPIEKLRTAMAILHDAL